jgi:hypothetical protein
MAAARHGACPGGTLIVPSMGSPSASVVEMERPKSSWTVETVPDIPEAGVGVVSVVDPVGSPVEESWVGMIAGTSVPSVPSVPNV